MLLPAALLMSLALAQQTPPPSPAPSPAVTPAVAAEGRTGATQGEAAQRDQPAATVRVCRTEPVTGSRFGRQVCRNSVETADDRRDSQEMLRRMQGSRLPDGN